MASSGEATAHRSQRVYMWPHAFSELTPVADITSHWSTRLWWDQEARSVAETVYSTSSGGNGEGGRSLADALAAGNIQVACLSGAACSDATVDAVCEQMRLSWTHLYAISFCECELSDAAFANVMRLLDEDRPVRRLRLRQVHMKKEWVPALCAGIGKSLSLESLDISKSSLPHPTIRAFLEAVLDPSSHLMHVDVDGVGLDEGDLAAVQTQLAMNTRLISLNLQRNSIRQSGCAHLRDALMHNHTLKVLCLKDAEIGDFGAGYLCEALMENATIEELNLAQNDLTDECPAFLGRVIGSTKAPSALRVLNLSRNHITPKGVHALMSAIVNRGASQTLRVLLLSSNKIGDHGLTEVAHAVGDKHCTLEILDVSNNGLTADSLWTLAENLKGNTVMRQLSVAYNRLGNAGAYAFRECLNENMSLVELDINHTELEDDGLLALLNPHPGHLQMLNVKGNKLTKATAGELRKMTSTGMRIVT